MTIVNANKKNITLTQKNKTFQNKTVGIKGEAPTPKASDVIFDSSDMPFEAENFLEITNNMNAEQKKNLENILKKILIFS